MSNRINNPYALFFDQYSYPLDGGKIYIGVAGQDPETDPVAVYFDAALTIAAAQPVRTYIGMPSLEGSPKFIFVGEDDYSIRVTDSEDNEIFYTQSAVAAEVEYQPLDSDLTAIAALSTTAFGRSLLTLANTAALATATGIPACLPLTGGAVTGNVTRSGAGPHLFHNDAAYTSGRVFVTANGAGDPTSNPGDIWIELEA